MHARAREYETIEQDVLTAETEVERLGALLASPEVMSDSGRLMELSAELATAESEVERLYARWQELEEIVS